MACMARSLRITTENEVKEFAEYSVRKIVCVASSILSFDYGKKQEKKRKQNFLPKHKKNFFLRSSLCINTYLPGVFEPTTNVFNLIKDSKAIWIHFGFYAVVYEAWRFHFSRLGVFRRFKNFQGFKSSFNNCYSEHRGFFSLFNLLISISFLDLMFSWLVAYRGISRFVW